MFAWPTKQVPLARIDYSLSIVFQEKGEDVSKNENEWKRSEKLERNSMNEQIKLAFIWQLKTRARILPI